MRIRKHSDLIPAGSVVVDLDFTIIDAAPFYREQARHRGYKLTLAQCNYNLIKQHVPADQLHEMNAAYMGDGTRLCEPFRGALDVLREYTFQTYIVTSRLTEFQRPALSWLAAHAPTFPQSHVLFFPSTAAKAKELAEFDIALAIDDKVGPLKALPASGVRLLFDPYEAFPGDAFAELRLVRSWEQIAEVLKSTVKPVL